MNKEELYQQLKKLTGISQEEFKNKYKEEEDEIKKRGIPINEEIVLAVLRTRFKKAFATGAKLFKGIIIGINQNIALNNIVDKVKADSEKRVKEDKQKAIELKICDDEGNALWHETTGVKVATWKLGNKITKDDYTQTILELAKTEEDEDYKPSTLVLRGDKRLGSNLFFKLVEFRANVAQSSTENLYNLNQSTATEIKIIDNKEINFTQLISKYLKSHCSPLSKLGEWHEMYKEDFNRFVITKGNVSNITLNPMTPSNIITLDSLDMPIEKLITCWFPKDLKLNFSDGTIGLYVIGSTNQREDGTMSINVYGYFTPPEWRIEKPEEIKEEKIVEKEVVKQVKLDFSPVTKEEKVDMKDIDKEIESW